MLCHLALMIVDESHFMVKLDIGNIFLICYILTAILACSGLDSYMRLYKYILLLLNFLKIVEMVRDKVGKGEVQVGSQNRQRVNWRGSVDEVGMTKY